MYYAQNKKPYRVQVMINKTYWAFDGNKRPRFQESAHVCARGTRGACVIHVCAGPSVSFCACRPIARLSLRCVWPAKQPTRPGLSGTAGAPGGLGVASASAAMSPNRRPETRQEAPNSTYLAFCGFSLGSIFVRCPFVARMARARPGAHKHTAAPRPTARNRTYKLTEAIAVMKIIIATHHF